jgi:hypothetical protein
MPRPHTVARIDPKAAEKLRRARQDPNFVDVSTPTGLFRKLCEWRVKGVKRMTELERRMRALEQRIDRAV